VAWTTPLTAVANSALTAAQWNASVRDNLLETAPAKATTAGRLFVSTGANAIAQREITTATVNTQETTTSTSYVDLATVGPQVTVTTGTRALVMWAAQMKNASSSTSTRAAVDVSGATTIAAADTDDIIIDGLAANNEIRCSMFKLYTTLTAGSNTFKVQYKVGGGTGTFLDRQICVIAL
jgi:hypothetical protein